jgi:hypothetical protein
MFALDLLAITALGLIVVDVAMARRVLGMIRMEVGNLDHSLSFFDNCQRALSRIQPLPSRDSSQTIGETRA